MLFSVVRDGGGDRKQHLMRLAAINDKQNMLWTNAATTAHKRLMGEAPTNPDALPSGSPRGVAQSPRSWVIVRGRSGSSGWPRTTR